MLSLHYSNGCQLKLLWGGDQPYLSSPKAESVSCSTVCSHVSAWLETEVLACLHQWPDRIQSALVSCWYHQKAECSRLDLLLPHSSKKTIQRLLRQIAISRAGQRDSGRPCCTTSRAVVALFGGVKRIQCMPQLRIPSRGHI